MWGYLTNEVYRSTNSCGLRERITAPGNNLHLREQEKETFESVRQNWIRRTQSCIQVNVEKFEWSVIIFLNFISFSIGLLLHFFKQIDFFVPLHM